MHITQIFSDIALKAASVPVLRLAVAAPLLAYMAYKRDPDLFARPTGYSYAPPRLPSQRLMDDVFWRTVNAPAFDRNRAQKITAPTFVQDRQI